MKKRGALELSIGTIVIVVLAMTMLVLGIVLLQNIFSGSTDAIDSINKGVLNEIDKLFSSSDKRMAVYPTTSKIEIKQGVQGKGFAFSIRNKNIDPAEFTYQILVDEAFDIRGKCRINYDEAQSWLLIESGSVSIPGSSAMDDPELVLFNIPETAPACTIPYKVEVEEDGVLYDSRKVYLTVKAK